MQLRLVRFDLQPDRTIGNLFIDGAWFCYVCEDVVRPAGEKVYAKTAIPYGRYKVVVTPSPRFKRLLPLLLDVPNFQGIRIHPGNTEEDTEGCLLPGFTRVPKGVGQSRLAFAQLLEKIQGALAAKDEVWITVTPSQEGVQP